jgi:hypothetical protein
MAYGVWRMAYGVWLEMNAMNRLFPKTAGLKQIFKSAMKLRAAETSDYTPYASVL